MGLARLAQKLLLRYGTQAMIAHTLRRMGVRLGKGCRIYTGNFGSEPWLIRIGDRVCVSNDVAFVNHGLTWPFQEKHDSLTAFGTIVIEDNCQIGLGAILLPGVRVGPNSIVGAGSVVSKDIPPDSVAAGNPARVVRCIDDYEKKCLEGHIDIPLDRNEARHVLEKHFWADDAKGPAAARRVEDS